MVCEGQALAAAAGTFGTVISAECFEHNPYWQATFENMVRVCHPGGLVIMTCATQGRPEHGTARTTPSDSPLTVAQGWDYYQNLAEQDFRRAFDLDAMFDSYEFEVDDQHHDLYFHGRKRRI
jgi:SAM-dependent methyltransferase